MLYFHTHEKWKLALQFTASRQSKKGNQTLSEKEIYMGPYLLKNKNEKIIDERKIDITK